MRRRLFLLVAATASLVLIAFLVPLALLVRDVAADRATAAASISAQSLAPIVATADRTTIELTLSQGASPVSVFWPNGSVLGAHATRDRAVELAARGRSITAQAPGGREILVAVQGVPGGTAVIRTFVSDAQLRSGVVRAWLILVLLGAGLLAVGLLVADRIARSMLGPIAELAGLSRRLSAGDLDARVRPGGPGEIQEAGTALNHLAARITDLLAGEREAAADLSHRLRTPLTALRLEAEALPEPNATRIGTALDALERTVTQVIHDTRHPRRAGAACDATQVVGERVAYWSALADEQDRTITSALPDHALLVSVAADDLAAAVDALLGNVFAHTPEGTPFAVTLDAIADGARLTVGDDGPGFTGDILARGHSGAGSTGLGLDIARRTAAGSIVLGTSPGGGAQITLTLPASS